MQSKKYFCTRVKICIYANFLTYANFIYVKPALVCFQNDLICFKGNWWHNCCHDNIYLFIKTPMGELKISRCWHVVLLLLFDGYSSYINTLKQELSGTKAYKETSEEKNGHCNHLALNFSVCVKERQDRLPTMY